MRLVAGFPKRRPGFEPRSGHVGFVDRWTGAGFLPVLPFPLPNLIPPTAPHSSGVGTIGQLLAHVTSGLNVTPPQETKKITTL
jgi:hypothetical protein